MADNKPITEADIIHLSEAERRAGRYVTVYRRDKLTTLQSKDNDRALMRVLDQMSIPYVYLRVPDHPEDTEVVVEKGEYALRASYGTGGFAVTLSLVGDHCYLDEKWHLEQLGLTAAVTEFWLFFIKEV